MIFSKDKEFKLEDKLEDLGFLLNLKTEKVLTSEELKKIKDESKKNKNENKKEKIK